MALKDIKLGRGDKKGGARKMSKRNIPVKRSINLATVGEKPIDLKVAIPAIVLIILLAALLGKFAVVDRLLAVSRAQAEVSALQADLDASYAAMKGQDDLSDLYAHYTYSGMTQEEIQRTDRVKVLQLLQKVVIPQAEVKNWSVSGNLLTINLMHSSLQEVNLLAQQLNEHELVDYCTVTTAATNRDRSSTSQASPPEYVTAQVLVYLKATDPDSEDGTAADGSDGDVVGDALDQLTDTVVGGVAGNITDDLAAGKEKVERENPKS